MFREAVRLKPDYVMANGRLALELMEQVRADDARSTSDLPRQQQEARPAGNDRDSTATRKARVDEAVGASLMAIRLKPDSADGYHDLGAVLKDGTDDGEAAIICYREHRRRSPESYIGVQSISTLVYQWVHPYLTKPARYQRPPELQALLARLLRLQQSEDLCPGRALGPGRGDPRATRR